MAGTGDRATGSGGWLGDRGAKAAAHQVSPLEITRSQEPWQFSQGIRFIPRESVISPSESSEGLIGAVLIPQRKVLIAIGETNKIAATYVNENNFDSEIIAKLQAHVNPGKRSSEKDNVRFIVVELQADKNPEGLYDIKKHLDARGFPANALQRYSIRRDAPQAFAFNDQGQFAELVGIPDEVMARETLKEPTARRAAESTAIFARREPLLFSTNVIGHARYPYDESEIVGYRPNQEDANRMVLTKAFGGVATVALRRDEAMIVVESETQVGIVILHAINSADAIQTEMRKLYSAMNTVENQVKITGVMGQTVQRNLQNFLRTQLPSTTRWGQFRSDQGVQDIHFLTVDYEASINRLDGKIPPAKLAEAGFA